MERNSSRAWAGIRVEDLDAVSGGWDVLGGAARLRNWVTEGASNAWDVARATYTGVSTAIGQSFRPGENINFTLGDRPSHDYTVRSAIPSDISDDAARYALHTRHAPVAAGGITSLEGDMLRGVITNNPVIYDRPPNNDNTVINITQPGHILHQGGDAAHRGQVANSFVTDADGNRFFESRGTAAYDWNADPNRSGFSAAWAYGQQVANAYGGYGIFRGQQEEMLATARSVQSQMDRGAVEGDMFNQIQSMPSFDTPTQNTGAGAGGDGLTDRSAVEGDMFNQIQSMPSFDTPTQNTGAGTSGDSLVDRSAVEGDMFNQIQSMPSFDTPTQNAGGGTSGESLNINWDVDDASYSQGTGGGTTENTESAE